MKQIGFLLVMTFLGAGTALSQACSELFFSEYIEGSSSNKAFEIYNPTNDTISLGDYVVYRNNNGSLVPTDSLYFYASQKIPPYEVFVVANPSAMTGIMTHSDTTHTVCFYNGDDALWLMNKVTQDTLDIIGEIGVDPGSGWVVGTGATNNNTLVRSIFINEGNTNWTLSSTEWDVFPIDMDDSLAQHTMVKCLEFTSVNIDSNVSCNGLTDGGASVVVQNGFPPYTYSWSNGDNNAFADSLGAGTHIISVTDWYGTVITDSVQIIEPAILVTTAVIDSNVSCFGLSNGGASVTTIGGTPNYTYAWSNGDVNVFADSLGAGTYSVITTDVNGCMDSSGVTISEPILPTSSVAISACDSYAWSQNSMTYTSSGMYMDTIPNAAGCDSVVVLNLTVNYSSVGIDTQTACDSLAWIDGLTYYASNNMATHTLINAVGCDSVVTLNLSILNSSSGIDTQTSCDSLVWIDGQTYYSNNNTATHILTNTVGCDSVVTLNLTINTVDVTVTNNSPSLSANAIGAGYQWLDCNNGYSEIVGETNQNFNATLNGDYAVRVMENGCSDTSSCEQVIGIGFNDHENDFGLNVYPNPSNGQFVLDFKNKDLKTFEVSILDVNGKLVLKQSNSSDRIRFDMDIPSGIYFLQLVSKTESETIKLMINK